MSSKSKQADRNAQKRAAKKDGAEQPEQSEPVRAGTPAMLMEVAKTSIMGSCLLKFSPKVLNLLKEEGGPLSGECCKSVSAPPDADKPEGDEDNDTANTDTSKQALGGGETGEIFEALCSRLTWQNALALAKPDSGVDAATLWMAFKGLTLDWGPVVKKKEKGTPKLDRILTNLCNNFVQYMHIMLLGFMLNCFLFRSFFSCLPWLFFYQLASVQIPLETIDKIPQVPLSKIPLKFRAAGTLAIHALLWLFFVYEAVWKCNFFIEALIFGLIIFHAHSVAPGSSAN